MSLDKKRDNNPRAFAETVSIAGWRSRYDSNGLCDLHIDVSFGEARLGEEADSPARFRLSLKRAEVHVHSDPLGVLSFPASGVRREDPVKAKISRKDASGQATDRGIDAGLSGNFPIAKFGYTAKRSKTSTKDQTVDTESPQITVTHRAAGTRSWVWMIQPTVTPTLHGHPWNAAHPSLKIRDSGFGKRRKGDPPDPLLQVRCRKEDLEVTDVQLKPRSFRPLLSPNKQMVVQQYIKDQILKMGLECGDPNEPFSIYILADAVPEVDQ